MATGYLTPEQDTKLRRWERWNRNYFIFAFVALIIVAPIVILQLRLACPACGHKIGWQAKLMAPDQCKSCGTFLRARSPSS